MKLSVSIYVDNQAEIGYPVSWLVPRFPESVEKIYIFASDDSNLRAVLAGIDDPRVVSEPIGIWIRKPNDIARAQNECLRRVDRKSYDAHLICQADIWPLPIAYERLESLPPSGRIHPRTLTVEHVRLHAKTHQTLFGITAVFPDTPSDESQFDDKDGDGAFPRGMSYWSDGVALAIDIGWHSVSMIARHLRVHARTWSSSKSDHLVRLADTNRRAFMIGAFDWIRRTMIPILAPMPLTGPYAEIIESMGLREEYDEACSVMQVPYAGDIPTAPRETTRQRSQSLQTKIGEPYRQNSRTTKRSGVRLKKIGTRWVEK